MALALDVHALEAYGLDVRALDRATYALRYRLDHEPLQDSLSLREVAASVIVAYALATGPVLPPRLKAVVDEVADALTTERPVPSCDPALQSAGEGVAMSAPKPGEFGEPWSVSHWHRVLYVRSGDNAVVRSAGFEETLHAAQNADRIVSCVNALKGRDPAALRELEEAALESVSHHNGGHGCSCRLCSALKAFGATQ